ncbi:hypothetical protein BJV82DRAFT_676465 [Fennellomyces sp. T-0311]|nr:hypothetical protein BJV82DRAFT_676465 [Fennellomyces sp. T-0311]
MEGAGPPDIHDSSGSDQFSDQEDFRGNTPLIDRQPGHARPLLTPHITGHEAAVTYKCKLSTALQVGYQPLRQLLRINAETYQVLRRDAMNLANLHVRLWLEGVYPNAVPPILSETFWHVAFESVAAGGETRVRGGVTGNQIWYLNLRTTYLNHFAPCRTNPQYTNPVVYAPPPLTALQNYVGQKMFSTKAKTNTTLHLLTNMDAFMVRAFNAQLKNMEDDGVHFPKGTAKFARAAVKRIKTNVLFGEHDWWATIGMNGQHPQALQAFYGLFLQQYNAAVQGNAFDNIADNIRTLYPGILRFSGWMLNHCVGDRQDIRKWSLLPIAKHQIGYMPFNNYALYLLTLEAHQLYHLPIPGMLINQHGDVMNASGFRQLTEGVNGHNKDHFWSQIFNFDRVNRHFRRFINNQQHNILLSEKALNFGFETDGVSISFRFIKKRTESYPQSRKEFQFLPREIQALGDEDDLEVWQRGIYHLNKEPQFAHPEVFQGEDRHFDVIGIDPGVRALFTAVGHHEPEDLADVQWRRRNIKTISNGEYQLRSGFTRSRQHELIIREHAGIQQSYDHLTEHPPTVGSSAGFAEYLRNLFMIHNDMHHFNTHYRHRETRERNEASRHMVMDTMADYIVSGRAKIPVQSASKHSRSRRKKVRQRTRDQDVLVNGPVVERAVVIAYGDADLRGTTKTLAPVPVKAFRRYLGKRALVVCTDEYRTSKVCYGCDNTLLDINDQNML